jgi:small-conductance mechanosensitive channel
LIGSVPETAEAETKGENPMEEKLEQFFDRWSFTADTQLSSWIASLSILVSTLLLFYLMSFLMKRIRSRDSDSRLVRGWSKFKTPVLITLLLIDFIIIKELYHLGEAATNTVNHISKVAIIFSVTWLIIKGIHFVRETILRQYDIEDSDNLKARRVYTQFRVLERILIFLVILIALAVALMTFDGIRRIGISLFASAGVAGIVVGFAAQKMLGNILAGFQIALTQPIRLDDVVIVENEWGKIEEINLTYVVVRIWDMRRLILPTTYFIEKPFQNWTRVSADILGTVYIYTDYHMPVDQLRSAFLEILKSTELWDGKVSVMQVTDATDRAMEIRALMSAPDSSTAWDLRVHVREKLIAYLQQHFPERLPRTRVEMTKPGVQESSPAGKTS